MKSIIHFLMIYFFFYSLFILIGYSQQKEIFINIVREDANTIQSALPINYQNGYRKSVSGQTIDYHSSHPDAEKALLVRAKQDVGSIKWESDTLTEVEGEYYNLIWLAGIEKSGWQQSNPHKFDFYINGEKWFTFKNLKDSSAFFWKVLGRKGSELSFKSGIADRFGDLFGYMTLKLSKSDFKYGLPLLFEVRGENAESPDWFMTFEYSFNFTPRLRLEPALLRTDTNPSQVIRLSLDNLLPGRSIEIFSGQKKLITQSLNIGGNIFFLPVEEVKTLTMIPVSFAADKILIEQKSVPLKPVIKREIHLLSYSHNDIGYTDLQPNIEKKQIKNLEEALRLIRQTKDYPPESQFKWNLEVIWALESYMKQASEEKRNEVIEEIKNGKLGLNALYANVLTGLASSVEMMHFTEYARKLTAEYSTPITTACVSDIPGFTWGLVTTLSNSGVKYFSSAPNNGDRVGHIYEMGDKPFYWTSQSGEEKILTWIAAASYSSFHEGDLSKLGDEKILKLMRKMDDSNYPYNIVQLPYTIGGDNGPPDPDLPDFVKRWNEKYTSPQLIISTHKQMFEEFEKNYGSTLPTLKGDLTPYWEDGAFSTSSETFQNRHAADRLIQSEAVWSMLSPEKFPSEDYYNAWQQVVLYDEHTWGAHNSITNPDSLSVKGQWNIKKQFATDADSMSNILLEKAFGISKANNGSIGVYNTNSWHRTDLVILPKEKSLAGDLVVDEKGKKIASQRLTTGELAFVAIDVPPFSVKYYFVKTGKAYQKGNAKIYGTSIENQLLSATINGNRGTIDELTRKKDGKQFVHGNGSSGLNRYMYVPGKDPDSAQYLKNVSIKVKERGPVVASLLAVGDAPGCRKYSSEVRIIDGIERIDIINNIDKIAIREKEGVHFEFPFNLSMGQLRYDVADGIVQPEKDQLPGSCKNFFSAQSFVDISNDEYGVTCASPDASLIEIGAINAEKPWMKTIEPSQTFYSYVMNNYWHTNYKADQEGPLTIRYSIMPHGKYKADEAVRFGRERREPLIVNAGIANEKIPASLFLVEPSEVLVTSCKPTKNGWLVRLYNSNDHAQNISIRWNKSMPVKISVSDIYERIGKIIDGRLDIVPYGSVYLRIDRKQ